MNEMPYGYCHCGCGRKTKIAKHNRKECGWVKDSPLRFIHGHHRRGVSNTYKGGRKIINGYVLIYKPEHLRSNKNGYVFEHILVMERILNRSLLPGETTHHIDENKGNNEPGNLILFSTPGSHISYHNRLQAFKMCGYWDWLRCPICKQYDDPQNISIYNKGGYISGRHSNCFNNYRKELKLKRAQQC
jgi:hypothetical protein